MDSNGDGIGDLPGITGRLEHVASLGVDAIWLSPFFTSPMKDFGYDVADYCDVDPMFGTLDDFKTLLNRAHALGLKVLIDQVISHSSDQHPWFQGEELGLPEAEVPYERLQDPYGLNFWPEFKGRDGCRTPMAWTRESRGGFSTVEPGLPVSDAHLASAVSEQEASSDSILGRTRKLIQWRQRQPALDTAVKRVVEEPGFEAQLEGNHLTLPPYQAFFGELA